MPRESGHTITVRDLYREQFDPLLPYDEILRDAPLSPVIALHYREIAAADGIIFVHPDWWGCRLRSSKAGSTGSFARGLPAGSRKRIAVKVFCRAPHGKGGAGVQHVQHNTPAERDLEVLGDPLERLWKDGIASFCGMPIFHRKMFSVFITSTEEQRKGWLAEVRRMTRDTFPLV